MTQLNLIQNIFQDNSELSIKDIASITGIKEPNIRRILGQGTIQGVFKRIAKGIYSLKIGDTTVGFLNGDSLSIVKTLKTKFDLVFLDIPYKTPAVIGGNRGIKYDTISPIEFTTLINDIKNIIHEDTYIVHCYSNAPSGWQKMLEYNNQLETNGFKCISNCSWFKTYKDGKPYVNVSGKVGKPEGINIYSLSGKQIDFQREWTLPKTNTASQKAFELVKDIIESLTSKGQWILDPFAGTGIVGFVSLILERNCVLIEKSKERFYNEILIPSI